MKTQNSHSQRIDQIKKRKAKQALKRLYSLPGMGSLKSQVDEFIYFAKISKLREENGLKSEAHSNHMLFLGNPGTGKTTAARLIGEAFGYMGLLKTEHENIPFVEIHHTDITSELVGRAEKNVEKKFEEARGGVLFIDEAYTFIGTDSHKSSEKVVAAIVQMLEDMRDEVMVIAAGYPKEMEDLMGFNPGLRSRFPNKVYFQDYGIPDLLKIAEFICEERDYRMSSGFTDRLSVHLLQEINQPNFGNARSVRNIVERSIKRQAMRLSEMEDPQVNDLMLLTDQDLEEPTTTKEVPEKEELIHQLKLIHKRLEELELLEMLG
ncbi:stage V sporulation protein K [Brevibacillus laterosporus]|uniref:AAA family ATPase n=1 Tax=Brevibacillus laterosporus TaxID=1465 RepID=UPI000C78DAD1|nr:AAA family ATPase [Brevibacillus laterosporus]AUM64299.1 stage V sporulation protein K [Brevibacillus laterosporus]